MFMVETLFWVVVWVAAIVVFWAWWESDED